MDNPQIKSAPSPGYETRDANSRGVFNFLVFLGVALVISAVICWGLFRYFSRHEAPPAPVSPFAETRPMSLGPQLQVNPREDLLKYREQQEQALETYGWENRATGTVRVPIERAMELLVQKGLPVQNPGGLQILPATADTPPVATKPTPGAAPPATLKPASSAASPAGAAKPAPKDATKP